MVLERARKRDLKGIGWAVGVHAEKRIPRIGGTSSPVPRASDDWAAYSGLDGTASATAARATAYAPRIADRLIDISHPIADGTITYPGLPAPEVSDHLSREQAEEVYAPGVTFQIGRICMVANTGTYVDAPFHRFADGIDLAGLPLWNLAGRPGIVVDPPLDRGPAIEAVSFHGLDLAERAVLVRTGWDRHWNTPQYGEGHPFLTRAAAEYLVEAGAAIVGIDSLNIDDTNDPQRPVHTVLLGNGIPICEHLCNLSELPTWGFRFHAAPVKVEGMGTFPVRAYAELD